MPARIATLEAELAREKEERAAEADDFGAMLVRIADVERAKAATDRDALQLQERTRELEARLADLEAREPPPPTEALPRVSELAAELERANTRIGELERLEAEARSSADALGTRLVEGRARAMDLEGQLASARGEIEAAREELNRSAAAIEITRQRAELAEKSAADGAEALKQAHAERETDRGRADDLEAKLTRVRREHGEAMEVERRERAQAIDAADKRHAEEVWSLQQKHDEAVTELLEAHSGAVDGLRRGHAGALAALESKHAEDARRSASAHDEKLAALRTMHDEKLAVLLTSQDEQVAVLRTAHEEKLTGLRTAHDEQLAALRMAHDERLTALRAEHAGVKRELSRALEEERSSAAKARQQASAAEIGLTVAREAMKRATDLLEEMARREDAAGALRAKSIEEARQALSAARAAPSPSPGATEAIPSAKRPRPPPPLPDARAATVSLDDLELDLLDSKD